MAIHHGGVEGTAHFIVVGIPDSISFPSQLKALLTLFAALVIGVRDNRDEDLGHGVLHGSQELLSLICCPGP